MNAQHAEDAKPYVVATDGACQRNPGPAGWAWVAEDGHWAAGSIEAGTNNIGELLALLHAIRDHAHVPRLTVQADSMYAINTYSSWMDGHARRGFAARWRRLSPATATTTTFSPAAVAEAGGPGPAAACPAGVVGSGPPIRGAPATW